MAINKDVFFERDIYTKPCISVNKSTSFPPHYHKHVEFIYITHGELYVTIDEKTTKLSEGDAAFIFPYRVHEYNLEESDGGRFIVVFEPEYYRALSNIFDNYCPQKPFLTSKDLEKHRPLINELIAFRKELSKLPKSFQDNIEYSVYLSKIGLLLADILCDTGITSNNRNPENIYLRVVKFCCDNFANENFSVNDIVENFHISRSRVQHIFSENANMGIKEYINFLRLRNAEQLLINTAFSVTEVALNSGFSTLRTFNRQFAQKNGLSPTKFRNLQKTKNT